MLKKRILSVVLCLCMVVGILPTVALAAVDSYIDYDITDTSHPFDGIWQWRDDYGYQLRCTYVAWHEAKSRLGIKLTNWGHAGSWVESGRKAGYQTGSTPAVNSIICWSEGVWGHVAYVTEVRGSTITVIEGGYGKNSYPKAHVRTIEKTGWENGTFIYLGSSTPSQPTAPSQRVTYNGQVSDNFYARIYNSYSGCYLENRNGNVQTANSDPSDPRQIWHFIHDDSTGSYKIVNMYDGCCLDAQDFGTAFGTNVQTHEDNGCDAQRWWLCGPNREIGLNSPFYFVPRYIGNHGLVMDIAGGDKITHAGTNIQLFYNHYWDDGTHHVAQDFRIIKDNSYSKPATLSAPTFRSLYGNPERTTISWYSVPVVSSYDSREYILQIYDTVNNKYVLRSQRVTGTSYTTTLPVGSYQAEIQAVNTKYANHKSGWKINRFTIYPVCTVTLAANPAEGGTVHGSGTYQEGRTATVTAAPDSGYHFVGWRENGQIVSTDASYTFTATGDRNLTAVFEKVSPVIPVYTVRVNASTGGSASGGGSYKQGENATVTADPGSGYTFKEWQWNGGSSADNPFTFSVGENRELTAIFEKEPDVPEQPKDNYYTIRLDTQPIDVGSVTGGGVYVSGTSATIKAAPHDGYHFVHWAENGAEVSRDAEYSFVVGADRNLTAVFEDGRPTQVTHAIQVNATAGGTASGGGVYQQGASVTVTAEANSGYRFVGWQIGENLVNTDAAYTFPATAELSLTAVFEPVSDPSTALFYDVDVISVPTTGGKVSGGGRYEEGAAVRVLASPNPGYRFVGWAQDGEIVSTNAEYRFEVNRNKYLTAVFETENCTITVNTDPAEGGTVTGGGVCERGKSTVITAVSNSDYQFVAWYENGAAVSTDASYTFTVNRDRTLTAAFESLGKPPAATCVISVSASPASGGTVTGSGSYQQGSSVTVFATANSNYRFVRWTENGIQVNTSASYSFTVGSDRALVAEFVYTGGSSTPGTPSYPSNPGSSSSDTYYIPPMTLPVKTDKISSGTGTVAKTTASPTAVVSGGKAISTVSTAIANEMVKQAVSNNSESVIVSPEVKGTVTRTEVTIPAAAVGRIGKETNAGLTVSTPVGNVTIPNRALSDLSSGNNLAVTMERNNNQVALTIATDGQTVNTVIGGVTLVVPVASVTPGTVAVLVGEGGSRQIVRKSVANGGNIIVPLSGSAKVEIVDNAKTFSDVPAGSWAANAVAFASGHELFSGTAPDTFSPSAPMTRGMLAVVLHNLESNPVQSVAGMFSDVASDAWYSEAVAWAAARGIVSGYGNGLFGPSDHITREQLAVMLWRYAGEPAATNKELHFNDVDKVSGYALDALCWATENGIINGKGDGILDPRGQATRAQVAQMLMNYLKK